MVLNGILLLVFSALAGVGITWYVVYAYRFMTDKWLPDKYPWLEEVMGNLYAHVGFLIFMGVLNHQGATMLLGESLGSGLALVIALINASAFYYAGKYFEGKDKEKP